MTPPSEVISGRRSSASRTHQPARADNGRPGVFYQREPWVVASELLGKVLVKGETAARIVEVEAYGGVDDPASHAHRNRTRRNDAMFLEGGHWYVYFSYGMHWCINVVCGSAGVPGAVLLRAAEPMAGLAVMRARRGAAVRDTGLCNGPAKLAQSFGVTGSLDAARIGTDRSGGLAIVDDGQACAGDPVNTVRVGISAGEAIPWRWYVPGSPHVSRPR